MDVISTAGATESDLDSRMPRDGMIASCQTLSPPDFCSKLSPCHHRPAISNPSPTTSANAIFGAPGFRKSLSQPTSIDTGTASRLKSKPGSWTMTTSLFRMTLTRALRLIATGARAILTTSFLPSSDAPAAGNGRFMTNNTPTKVEEVDTSAGIMIRLNAEESLRLAETLLNPSRGPHPRLIAAAKRYLASFETE